MNGMVKKIVTLLLLLCGALGMDAQLDKLRGAFIAVQNGNLDSAKILIDAASKHPETMNEGQTWYLKGFIYKDIFKKTPVAKREVSVAKDAFEASKKSILLDTTRDNKQNNLSLVKSECALVNNSFGEMLDSNNYKKAIACIDLEKELVHYLRPKAKIDSLEAYYYMVFGSAFQSSYEKSPKKNQRYLRLAEEGFNNVLIREPNNIMANYDMGIIYYNQAVSVIMNKLDYDYDIVTLNDIQSEALSLFKKSLPYMEKAYQLNPRRKETLVGLSGIYYSLHDNEKYEQFQKLSKDMDKQ